MFEQLPDIHVDSSEHNPIPPIDISTINAANRNVVQKEDNEKLSFFYISHILSQSKCFSFLSQKLHQLLYGQDLTYF